MIQLRSLQTHPPPSAYPLSQFSIVIDNDAIAVETIEEFEGHREPTFQICNTKSGETILTTKFRKPFQVDERKLLEHLIETIQKRTEGV